MTGFRNKMPQAKLSLALILMKVFLIRSLMMTLNISTKNYNKPYITHIRVILNSA